MTKSLPDVADFSDWLGRSRACREVLTPRLAAEFETTLAPHVVDIDGTVPGIFWALAPDIASMSDLGRDGHPRTGLFLPELPYPRRMWAGGEVVFYAPIRIGDEVIKSSVIEDIAFKTGSSGPLGFVTVRHTYTVKGANVIEERQDIVYRPETLPNTWQSRPVAAKAETPSEIALHWEVSANPVMLARFSAVTFNGHRIHYDAPYATGVEGYAGLVVHGPLQATLMLNIAASTTGRLPQKFRYRGSEPLICGTPFAVEALKDGNGRLTTRVVARAGFITMTGTVEP
jgi:3-methylfumaryl-CoA hydratase